MKECPKCNQVKSFEAFAKCKSRKDGLQLQCKQCKAEQNRLKGYSKKCYNKDPEKYKKKSAQWQKDNAKRHYEIVKRYRKNNPIVLKNTSDNYAYSIPPGVYGIKCLINGKMYIGESKHPILRRGHHLGVAKSEGTLSSTNINLQEDIQKYGKDNFIFGIIEETDNHKEREKYWIDYYQPEYND